MVILPILSLNNDMWDGVIVDYSSKINLYIGLKSWFIESNWLFQYPYSVILIELSNFFNISYKNLNAIYVFVIFCLFINEIYFFLKNILKMDVFFILGALILISFFPNWGDLLSSITSFHFTCLLLGIVSIRLLHNSNNVIYKAISLIFLLISFSLQSLLLFLVVFSLLFDFDNCFKKNIQKPHLENFYKTIYVLLIAIIYFFCLKLFHPPHNNFDNYNSFIQLDFIGLKNLIINFIYYLTYLLPLFLILIFFYFYNFNALNLILKNKSFLIWLMLLFILFLSGAIPYLLVGKYSYIWGIWDWNSRQSFLITFPVCSITAFFLNNIYFVSKKRINLEIILSFLFISLFLLFFFNFRNFLEIE